MRYLGPNNPFKAYPHGVYELRLDDAWKSMITAAHIESDIAVGLVGLMRYGYPEYLKGYMQCRKRLLARQQRFIAFFTDGSWQTGFCAACALILTMSTPSRNYMSRASRSRARPLRASPTGSR